MAARELRQSQSLRRERAPELSRRRPQMRVLARGIKLCTTIRVLHVTAKPFTNGQFFLPEPMISLRGVVLPDRIELSTSPLPNKRSTVTYCNH